MPSPDVRPYVDLTLFDRDPQDLIDTALADAAITLPDWDPREGNTEMVILESDALQIAELIYAINRVPGAVVEVLLRLFGEDRDQGTSPSATIRFKLSDALGHVIPEVTARLDLGADVGIVDFLTDAPLNVAGGTDEGTVTATGDRATEIANGVAAGTLLELLDSVPYVDEVSIDVDIPANSGLEPETGEAFLDRGAQTLRRLVETLVLPEHFSEYALGQAYVYRATGVDNYDPAVGPDPGDNAGHMTVVVLGEGGGLVDAGDKAILDAEMEERAQGNLSVHVEDPALTAQAVDVTVVRDAAYTAPQVEAAVTARLQLFLNTDTWPWGRDVYRNELIAEVSDVAGVDRVTLLTTPAADVVIPFNGLVGAGAIAVTVDDP